MIRAGKAPLDTWMWPMVQGLMNQTWMGWFTNIAGYFASSPQVSTTSQTVSPYTYTNNATYMVQVMTTGGTVSAQTFTRAGTAYTITPGTITLSQGDSTTYTFTGTLTLAVSPL